ncbi:hypothetical protein UlMin_005226 [Ulmus minor]
MAKTLQITISTILLLISTITTAEKEHTFSSQVSPKKLGLHKKKLTHLHFFFHDYVGGRHPTAVTIAEAKTTNTSSSFFGRLVMFDNPLTLGPKRSSKLVGRAQGMYGYASQTEICLLMVLNFVFTEGEFNGSSIGLLGRNAVLSEVREMPVVGGSGVFRFARGYAQARTRLIKRTVAVVEYDVFVLHY